MQNSRGFVDVICRQLKIAVNISSIILKSTYTEEVCRIKSNISPCNKEKIKKLQNKGGGEPSPRTK